MRRKEIGAVERQVRRLAKEFGGQQDKKPGPKPGLQPSERGTVGQRANRVAAEVAPTRLQPPAKRQRLAPGRHWVWYIASKPSDRAVAENDARHIEKIPEAAHYGVLNSYYVIIRVLAG